MEAAVVGRRTDKPPARTHPLTSARAGPPHKGLFVSAWVKGEREKEGGLGKHGEGGEDAVLILS